MESMYFHILYFSDPFDLSHNLGRSLSLSSKYNVNILVGFDPILLYLSLSIVQRVIYFPSVVHRYTISAFRNGRTHFGTPLSSENLALIRMNLKVSWLFVVVPFPLIDLLLGIIVIV